MSERGMLVRASNFERGLKSAKQGRLASFNSARKGSRGWGSKSLRVGGGKGFSEGGWIICDYLRRGGGGKSLCVKR